VTELATDLADVLSVEVYRRVAELVVAFPALAADEGMPLTEVQTVLLVTIATQAFDGMSLALADHLSADAGLRTGRMRGLLGTDWPDA
jgi:hypothetical protein